MNIPLRNMHHEIIGYATVDEADFENVNQHAWYKEIATIRKDGSKLEYARGTSLIGKLFMHQYLMGPPPDGLMIDHIDHNGLNNKKSINLRFVTQSQNSQNVAKKAGTVSQYKGVTFEVGKWRAKLADHHLGRFETEMDAGKAYDVAAFQLFGEHAAHNKLLTVNEKLSATQKRFQEPIRKLPKGVEKAGNRFCARMKTPEYGRVTIGRFDSAEEAGAAYDKRLAEITKTRMNRHFQTPIPLDENGKAFIVMQNSKKEPTHRMFVDREDWHKLALHSWYFHKGHPAAKIDKKYITIKQFMKDNGKEWNGTVTAV